jgi:hypothetical protein
MHTRVERIYARNIDSISASSSLIWNNYISAYIDFFGMKLTLRKGTGIPELLSVSWGIELSESFML